jgi:hypothetical protein
VEVAAETTIKEDEADAAVADVEDAADEEDVVTTNSNKEVINSNREVTNSRMDTSHSNQDRAWVSTTAISPEIVHPTQSRDTTTTNNFFCWTHGCDVDHDGYHCQNPAEGHIPLATRDNPMNGCMKKAHNTIMSGGNM